MIDYNVEYYCRYHKNDIFLDSDDINTYEMDFVRDILYKEDLMNIFNMKDDEEFDSLNPTIQLLYKSLIAINEFKECMKVAAAKIISEDEELGLCILYSYDYMYLTHDFVSDYLITNTINKKKIENILNKLQSD